MSREWFFAMNKLKYKPTITSSIPNYIRKVDALFERVDYFVGGLTSEFSCNEET